MTDQNTVQSHRSLTRGELILIIVVGIVMFLLARFFPVEQPRHKEVEPVSYGPSYSDGIVRKT